MCCVHRAIRSGLRSQIGYFVAISVVSASALLGFCKASMGAELEALHIGAGDLLQIQVFGDDSVTRLLSGQYRIGPDGAIEYPLLGRMSVVGMTPADLAQAIKAALGDQIPISGSPMITIQEYAPVFLLGSIPNTGPFPFRPGLTVFHLILMAGGLPQEIQDESRLLAATQEIADLELLIFSLEIERARLLAEVQDKDFDVAILRTDAGVRRSSLIDAQASIFAAHRLALDSQTSAYEAQRATYDQEIQSISQSIALHDEEVRLIENQLATQQQLVDRGFSAESRLIEDKRQLTAVRRESLALRTALFQAEQNRLAVEQKLADAELSTDARNLELLSEVELNIMRTGLKIEVTRRTLAQVPSHSNAQVTSLGRMATYTIFRPSGSNGNYERVIADESAELQRGDILRVDLIMGKTEALGEQSSEGQGVVSSSPD